MLTVETGAIVPGANAYVTLAEANAYLAHHAKRTAWNALTDPDKEANIVQATRALDSSCAWKGAKVDIDQPREWPRTGVITGQPATWNPRLSNTSAAYPENKIPQAVKDASCELAALMMDGDRTADSDSAGVKSLSIGKGAVAVEFDSETAPTILGRIAPLMLSEFTQQAGGTGSLPTYRV